ncbi:MAG: aldose 1-epimerase family protein [Planctomycetota bacterium]|jgi:galactose mutarotase-like enzyme
MAQVETVLTDVDSGVWLDSWKTNAADGLQLAGASAWSISKRTLRGGLSDGVDVVTLDNGNLSLSVLPTRGMGLWKGSYRGLSIEWKSPVARPVNPQFVNLQERGGLGWLAGFNELMCRCGLAFNGPPGVDRVVDCDGNVSESELTLHGKIANLPAHRVSVSVDDDGDGTLSVTGVVDEAMMFGSALRLTSTISTKAGSNALTITDTVFNPAAQPMELELLYHTNIGRPFLDEGSRIVAAIAEVAPRDDHSATGADSFDVYPGPVVGRPEEAFFFDLQAGDDGSTAVLLKNPAGDCGLQLRFAKQQLPCFTLWKNTQADQDGFVTGLEPGTNFPNLKTFEREQGRVVVLKPGQSHTTQIELSVFDTAVSVADAEAAIRELQSGDPVKHAAPIAKFSPI